MPIQPRKVSAEDLDLFSLEASAPQQEGPRDMPVDRDTLMRDLNDVQREAVTTTDGPTLIVAGAGSGKTRVLTRRVAWLLAGDTPPWRILALTFTNKAAREMRGRIADIVGERRAGPLWMGTFHSLFSRILRREAEEIGYTASFTIYDTDDSLALIRQIMSSRGISQKDYSPKGIRNRISAAKNALVHPGAFRASTTNPFEERVARVYEDYENRLRANNAMDFDDLLVRTIELFEKSPASLERWSEQFRYILIDEYQDTNRAQYAVVKMLAAKHNNLCVVGDDAQSIYKFRGADIRNILDFERDYPDLSLFRLEQNYRSTKRILAAAEGVIKRNRSQIEKDLWTENPEGEKIRVLTLRDERDEGSEVVRVIERERDRGVPLSEIAALYRTNSQSLSIEDAMRRANIPYALVGGVAFYQRAEVKDALAYLRLLVNPRDDESFLRSVNRPARGIGEVTLRRLRASATGRNETLLQAAALPEEVVDLTPRARKGLSGFAAMVERWSGLLGEVDVAEIARMVVTESGLLQAFQDEGTPEAIARWDNVQRLLSHVAEYAERQPEGTLDEYLQEISLLSDLDNHVETDERVTLMTIHAAKGLEFRVVFLPGLEEGLFPIGQTGSDPDELEEERRLFYVAVTRAKERLYMSNCERRYRFGELSYPTASRFLNEIDDEHLEFNAMATGRSTAGRGMSGHRADGRQVASEGGTGRVPSQRRRPNPWAADSDSGASASKSRSKPDAESAWAPDPIPEDDYSQIPRSLEVGATVEHSVFGRGLVESLVGSGDKARAAVRFESVGRKQLVLKFAGLRVV